MEKYVLDRDGLANLALDISKIILPGHFLALNGDLGTGKTFFVSKLLESLGGEQVSSPTYTILNEYSSDKGRVIHIDAYRLQELDYIGFEDYLAQNVIIVMEWADKFKQHLPTKRIQIDFEYYGDKRLAHVHIGI